MPQVTILAVSEEGVVHPSEGGGRVDSSTGSSPGSINQLVHQQRVPLLTSKYAPGREQNNQANEIVTALN